MGLRIFLPLESVLGKASDMASDIVGSWYPPASKVQIKCLCQFWVLPNLGSGFFPKLGVLQRLVYCGLIGLGGWTVISGSVFEFPGDMYCSRKSLKGKLAKQCHYSD